MDDGFSYTEKRLPHAFIQWKGTDVCMDFRCECGANCHFDGDFAYTVRCPHCQTVWEMPFYVYPRKACADTHEHWRKHPQELEPDKEMADGRRADPP